MHLADDEQAWLNGEAGAATELAMRLLVAAAETTETQSFVPIEMAHINSCHYSGRFSLDFAEFLLREGVTLAVPTHTNASLVACESPQLRPRDDNPEEVDGAMRLMAIYEELGCTPMWTCAPYQQPEGRPAFGQQIAGSESNAVGFFNSVLGARTNKYGDLLDISAAITGRVPFQGLHTDAGRHGQYLFTLRLSEATLRDSALPHLLGVLIGETADSLVPVIDGLEWATEDDLKAIAAAAAAAGAVALFHVVGITPEAPDLQTALGHHVPLQTTVVTDVDIADCRRRLSSVTSGTAHAVCLGTPHFSVHEFVELHRVLAGRTFHADVTVIVTTSRAVHAEAKLRGLIDPLEAAGAQIVLDTCSYYTPRPTGVHGTVVTNSAKWAYYAPGTLGVDVAFGSVGACVESAVSGEVML